VIRPARPDEAERLAALHVAVWRKTYRDIASPEAFAQLDETRRLPYWTKAVHTDQEDAGVLVAEVSGNIVGVVSFGPSAHEAFEGRMEIKHIYVSYDAHGHGIGRRLLEAVLNREGPGGSVGTALAVVRENDQARRFYQRMGGVEIATFIDPGPLWRSDNIVVAWD
jgi:ribosomal protein S18 acetylase RimI-like enzyme